LPRALGGRGASRATGRDESNGDGCCRSKDENVENGFHAEEGTSFESRASSPDRTVTTIDGLRCVSRVRPGAECEAKSGVNPALSRNCEALRG